ncbi:MAG: hypothetical protein GY854_33845 [Deltaproteobacteria bacterium]|nr:hypothetical protein [Deltaproteobacteria bacterium]
MILAVSISLLVSSVGAEGRESASDREWTLAIAPLGKIDNEALQTAAKSIKNMYGWKVVTMARRALPESAWYKPRRRHRAEKILDWLHPRRPRAAHKIMAVTKRDISTTKGRHKDWGICGLAELGGEAAVVSSFRIKRKMKGLSQKKRKEVYLKRLEDLTTHEFGHQLGLPHCPNKGCIMEDAKGTVNTFDHSTGQLCADCRHLLKDNGYLLP